VPVAETTPKVSVISLGGTIAMTRQSASNHGVAPALDADALLAAVPGLQDSSIALATRSLRSLPGASLGFDDLDELAAVITEDAATGPTGFVITQGTDTIEETAYYLDLATNLTAPIVVAGAMRNPTMAGADGPANLLAAVQVAASSDAHGLGCLVVMNDEIHAARHVRKTHAISTAAFTSPNSGPLGRVVEGQPRFHTRPGPRPTLPNGRAHRQVRVGLVPICLGDDGELLRSLGRNLDGLVIAAFGAGHVPATLVPLLEDHARRIPVILTSRTGAGPVLRHTYGFSGSEQDLQDRGLINGSWLDPYKARVLLHLLLANRATSDEITAAYQTANQPPAAL
jgi:L-asparaginase